MTVTYKVYRGGSLIASPSGTSYSDTGLVNGTAYSYQVSAVRDGVEGSKSSAVTATPVAAPVGNAHYIAPTGSDGSGDGSIGNPWASIQKFIDTEPAAGSTLYLRGGTYNPATQGGLTARDTYGSLIGTAEAPITIRNYPGETPSFPNAVDPIIAFWPNDTSNTVGVSHVILYGIRFPGCAVDDAAAIVIGGAETVYRLVNNVTIRNCYMSLGPTDLEWGHCIGAIHNADTVLIEGCTFVGTGIADKGGEAFTLYSTPATINATIRRCTFENFTLKPAVQIWDEGATKVANVTIDHCSFRNNSGGSLDLRYHAAGSVTNCAFDVASGSAAIYDPTYSAITTKAYNFYSQTFDGTFHLAAGQTGHNAASDGTDAGAIASVEPPGGGTIAQFPGGGASTPAAFATMAANLSNDVIEIAAGTYANWSAFLNVDRTAAHPLLVRPAPNAAVVWDGGGGDSPAWRIGWGGYASYITFEPVGTGGSFTIQNYIISLSGLVMSRYTNHITFNGVIVRNCNGTVSPQTSHCVYLDVDSTHRAQYWTSNNWDVIGPANHYLNGFQTEHTPNADHVIAHGWTVSKLHRASYLYGDATDVSIDGWTISDCDATFDNQGGTTTGVISNCHSTNSGTMAPGSGYWLNNGRITNGGGNTAS